MSKKGASSLHRELMQGERKLSKRKHRLLERLEKARDAKEHTEKRLQRMQARLEKRSTRVQRLETKLERTSLQLQELKTPAQAATSDMQDLEDENTNAIASGEVYPLQEEPTDEIEIQIFERPLDNSSNMQATDITALAESIVQAQEARNIADVAEDAARATVERAQAAEHRLNEFGTARHLGPELTQMQDEAERALQLARQAEQAAIEAEQEIWPLTLQDIDEKEEHDSEYTE